MSFRKQLNFIKDLNVNIYDLSVANECDIFFQFDYNDEQFEDLCNLVKETSLKYEKLSICDVANTINILISDKNKTIEDVLYMAYDTFEKECFKYI